jgi:hypothetical protein
VVVPSTFSELTSRRVLTVSWLDGEKLSQSKADDVGDLVNIGVICYLKQLLDTGASRWRGCRGFGACACARRDGQCVCCPAARLARSEGALQVAGRVLRRALLTLTSTLCAATAVLCLPPSAHPTTHCVPHPARPQASSMPTHTPATSSARPMGASLSWTLAWCVCVLLWEAVMVC